MIAEAKPDEFMAAVEVTPWIPWLSVTLAFDLQLPGDPHDVDSAYIKRAQRKGSATVFDFVLLPAPARSAPGGRFSFWLRGLENGRVVSWPRIVCAPPSPMTAPRPTPPPSLLATAVPRSQLIAPCAPGATIEVQSRKARSPMDVTPARATPTSLVHP